MAADALLILQASVTKVDTFQSAGVDLGGVGNSGAQADLVARVLYSAANEASGGKTVIFSIEQSDASGSGYVALASAADQTLTLTTTAQAGEIFIPFRATKRYIRLVETLSANTNSPTITYQADVVQARP